MEWNYRSKSIKFAWTLNKNCVSMDFSCLFLLSMDFSYFYRIRVYDVIFFGAKKTFSQVYISKQLK